MNRKFDPKLKIPMTGKQNDSDLLNPTISEWRVINFESIFANSPKQTIENHHASLQVALTSARAKKDEGSIRVLAFAEVIAGIHLQVDGIKVDLKPLYVNPGRGERSIIPDDFSPDQLDLLAKICNELADQEFRARIGHILWLRRPHKESAIFAATAYFESAKQLLSSHFDFKSRLAAALQISSGQKKNLDLFRTIIGYAEGLFEKFADEDGDHLILPLIELLIEYKGGDLKKMYDLAMRQGVRWSKQRFDNWGQFYFNLAQQCAKRLGATELEFAAISCEAETHFTQGQVFNNGDPQGSAIASTHFGKAIHTYRKAPRAANFKSRIDEIHGFMLKCQEIGVGAMQKVSVSVDVPEEILALAETARGMDFVNVVNFLALTTKIAPKVDLQAQALMKINKLGPMQVILPTSHLKDGGLVDSKSTPLKFGEPIPGERIIEEMHSVAQCQRQILGLSFFIRVQRIALEEHEGELNLIANLVAGNPFVPPGRESTYCLGLLQGFHGNFAVAAHLLIPQIENSVRHILGKADQITSSFNHEGIQDSYDLNRMLPTEELKLLLGEDITFDLIGLLISRYGDNLRNRLMHGLVSDSGMEGLDMAYVWAMTIRLLILHLPPTPQES